MPRIKRIQNGFTLIEILIVIAIIGILASVIYVALDQAQNEGGDTRRGADMEQLKLTLETYRAVNGEYPPTAAGGGSFSALNALIPKYLSTLPEDPLSADGVWPSWSGTGSDIHAYYYWRADNMPAGCSASKYIILYHLEGETNGNAPSCIKINDHSYAVVR